MEVGSKVDENNVFCMGARDSPNTVVDVAEIEWRDGASKYLELRLFGATANKPA